ncbi:hypothetical protein ATN84_00335 [Paramesorhizobium deserti]|uniref:DUF2336 domain-containing protein n=1 Tax=Paramesorhizobium deserti TaxID=1494590 RepID=A0A135HYN2_9HYPH|nr:DUF2336 domain-containing protein [Paramesorhizobium deserti]KXF78289.1 hypothetical protein ATN84_00335 [Paramesorhizobium deserti]
MTNEQFRALEALSGSGKANGGKADDLLSAAVTAFTAITRPARNDIQQLEDLTLPLLENATARGKRHAAAVLSQMEHAPRNLVLTLCDEAVEIAAPLLLRSPILTSTDLVDIIGRQGLGHARAIARRPQVDPIVQSLLESFADPAIDRSMAVRRHLARSDDARAAKEPAPVSDAARQAHDKLRAIMREETSKHLVSELQLNRDAPKPSATADHMIDTALLIDPVFFRNLLADTLGVSFEHAEAIIGKWPDSRLPIALRALGLSAQDSYLILTAVLGTIHSDKNALRDFVHIYRSIERETALAIVRRWKAGDMTALLREKLREMAAADDEPVLDAANSDGAGPLKAVR